LHFALKRLTTYLLWLVTHPANAIVAGMTIAIGRFDMKLDFG
jgi:hypothetical protein